MEPDPESQQSVQFLASIINLATLNLSVEHYFKQVLSRVPDELWQRIIGNSPTWFEFYFQTPVDAFRQILQSPSAAEGFKVEGTTSDPFAIFEEIYGRATGMAGETVSVAQDLLSRDGPVYLADGAEFSEGDIRELALFKSLSAETRARATYGQGMLALVDVGTRGNDDGYFRAVTIDPTVQWHPALAKRISRDDMGGRNDFATKLQKAAQKGPTKKISKDLNQLRYMLSLLREWKILQEMSKAERYDVLCRQLGLYPDKGEEPEAGLHLFIKRWEASLLL